jgi:hypothetical protein
MWRELVSRIIIMIAENSINWSGHEFGLQSCSDITDDMLVYSTACYVVLHMRGTVSKYDRNTISSIEMYKAIH